MRRYTEILPWHNHAKNCNLKHTTDTNTYLELQLLAATMGAPDVAEIDSPPRITALAHRMGLTPGFALGLTVLDPHDNMPWNFNIEANRKRAMHLPKNQKPMLLIGSPMCKAFSVLNNLNRENMGETKWNALMQNGIMHLIFASNYTANN